jgi:pyridoxine 5'-phosphate synthase PdxJ
MDKCYTCNHSKERHSTGYCINCICGSYVPMTKQTQKERIAKIIATITESQNTGHLLTSRMVAGHLGLRYAMVKGIMRYLVGKEIVRSTLDGRDSDDVVRYYIPKKEASV